MTILCRNEQDIIECNIRTHAQLGVDAFVVMDNGSTDGTREKLFALSSEFDLTLIDESGHYQQALWMNQLSNVARDQKGADLVINNDADEFWLPQKPNTSLKDHLNTHDSVVTIQKSNMLLTQEALKDHYTFQQADHRVVYPIAYNAQTQLDHKNINLFFAPLSPKVITNPYGLIKLSGGNHRAKHIAKWRARPSTDIRVYHYPIRDYQQFKANIEHRALLLKQNAKMGNHYRRWVKMLADDSLYEEFQRLTLSNEQLRALNQLGITVQDTLPKTTLSH